MRWFFLIKNYYKIFFCMYELIIMVLFVFCIIINNKNIFDYRLVLIILNCNYYNWLYLFNNDYIMFGFSVNYY